MMIVVFETTVEIAETEVKRMILRPSWVFDHATRVANRRRILVEQDRFLEELQQHLVQARQLHDRAVVPLHELLDGECEVNEVWFDNVEVPAENLIGQENKGWDYAKYLLAHERTNIADVNRAKRELERLKRIARAEGMFDEVRFRDEIAKLEVEIVALEMMVLRVLSAEKSGKQSLDIAGLLKIRGSEIQQRYSELMMLAAGPYSLPFIAEAMEAGWQGDHVGAMHCAPLASTYFNMRKTTIYGGSNEVQRNIVAQTVLG